MAARLGCVPSGPDAALALLGEGALVGVFPEGAPSAPRPWNERYRLRRFGRGGFARLAALAGVPIVPCAIVGSGSERFTWRGDGASGLANVAATCLTLLGHVPPHEYHRSLVAPAADRAAG